jgi:aspartyl-tRNA(Asn)/glutamyl-tRNA(Gln) amidotransferase subunit C
MAISKKDVEYVARLARLKLSEEEKERFQKELGTILDYFDQLKGVNTEGVPPTSHVIPLENVFREDQVKSSLSTEQALVNAPEKKDSYFKVPQVIG